MYLENKKIHKIFLIYNAYPGAVMFSNFWNKSEFDSVDIITFLTMIENNFERELGKKLNLLDENFFFKYETLNIKNIFDYIKKIK